jgi:hypothetical protein
LNADTPNEAVATSIEWKWISQAYRYLRAAKVLVDSEEYQNSRVFLTPTLNLVAHGVEISLKSNLIIGGASENEAKGFNHNIMKLWSDERNAALRKLFPKTIATVWRQAQATGRWADGFIDNPHVLFEEYLELLARLHSNVTGYALRYVAPDDQQVPRPHLLLDAFLKVTEGEVAKFLDVPVERLRFPSS